MKKCSFFAAILFCTNGLFAQAPQGINYQAAIRTPAGAVLANQAVSIKINIRTGAINGTVAYSETFSVTTNGLGLVNLVIGQGAVQSGVFANLAWGNAAHFAEIMADVAGGAAYQTIGTQQLMSVPYALHAKYAETSGTTYTAGTGVTIASNVVAAQNTQALWNANQLQGKPVNNTAPTVGQILIWNGTAWIPSVLPAPNTAAAQSLIYTADGF
jgi:hypothetical protein